MPWAPKKPCGWRGCGRLTAGRFCPEHQAQYDQSMRDRQRETDRQRGSSASRGYGRGWQKARADFLREHPLCECPDCQAGVRRVTPATVVDHIVPHRGDPALFWDRKNWQAMSAECHNRKTAREDGGLGNRRRSTR